MKLLQARCTGGSRCLGPRLAPPLTSHGSTTPLARRPLQNGRRLVIRASSTSDEEPDWDKEMSIFTKRTMAPNQLATLREMESKVSLGKVSKAVILAIIHVGRCQGFQIAPPPRQPVLPMRNKVAGDPPVAASLSSHLMCRVVHCIVHYISSIQAGYKPRCLLTI